MYYFPSNGNAPEIKFSGWVHEDNKQAVIDKVNAVASGSGNSTYDAVDPVLLGWETRGIEEIE